MHVKCSQPFLLPRLLLLLVAITSSQCIAGGANSFTEPGADDGSGVSPPFGAGAGDPIGTGVNDPNAADLPFDPVSPKAYVSKIKNLITGQYATDQEAQAGSSAAGLAALVETWVESPSAQNALFDFFQNAFQQQYITSIASLIPFGNGPDGRTGRAATESFARTALDTVQNNRPFTELYTTHTFMMNSHLLLATLVSESFDVSDTFDVRDRNADDLNFKWTMTPQGGPIDPVRSANPADPDYLIYYGPNIQSGNPNCHWDGPVTITRDNSRQYVTADLWNYFVGDGFAYNAPDYCFYWQAGNSQVKASDETDWRMVELKPVPYPSPTTPMWDLATIRTTKSANVRRTYVGFFSTTAFVGQWLSNSGNQARAIANQAMIVGLGRTFDGADLTMPASLAALDASHAPPDSACYSCHLTMDPMRQYFRQAYTHLFHIQKDAKELALPGVWAVDGQTAMGTGIDDYAARMAAHPDVAINWTRKLCNWMNSGPCLAEDPELIRLSQVFSSSNFNFKTLLKAMLVSPLTTYATSTLTARRLGVNVSMARKQQICRTLSARLGINDLCGLRGTTQPGTLGALSDSLVAVAPDSYSRGLVDDLMVSTPTLLSRTGLENVCALVATQVVDKDAGSPFTSGDVPAAVASITSKLLGRDGASGAAYTALLQQHVNDAKAAGANASAALRSAFVLACLSPQVTMIGL